MKRWLYRTQYRRSVIKSLNDVKDALKKLFRVVVCRPHVVPPRWICVPQGKPGQILKDDGVGYRWVYPKGGPAK